MKRSIFLFWFCFVSIISQSQNWFLFPDNLNWYGQGAEIKAIEGYKDRLYVGGVMSDPYQFGYWNEDHWDTIPHGDTNLTPVAAMIEFEGKLYIAARFVPPWPNTNDDFHLATWDGEKISKVPGGFTTSNIGDVLSLCVYNGELYVGGNFPDFAGINCRVVKWNGSSWSSVGCGIYGSIRSMAVYNDELYISADRVGGPDIVCRYNGTFWDTVGIFENTVFSLEVDTVNNILYAGGGFYGVNNIPAYATAQFDGTQWKSMPGEMMSDGVLSMCMYHGKLYVGSANASVTDLDTNFACWDGMQWQRIKGPNGSVTKLNVFKDTLYVGGIFTTINGDTSYSMAKYYSPPLAIDEPVASTSLSHRLKVYPNPSGESFTVEVKNGNSKNLRVEICDIEGKIIYQSQISSEKTEIPAKQWPRGTYFITILSGDKVIADDKIIIH